MPTKQKNLDIAWLKEKFEGSGAVVVSHNLGLKVEEVNELRNKLREAGSSHKVSKNTLSRIAIQGSDREGLAVYLSGPTVVSFLPEDFVGATKILADFAKDHEKLAIQGGYFDGEVTDANGVIAISKLPSREELLAKLAGTLNNPITGIVRVLNGTLQGFATVLGAIQEQKEKAA